MHPALTSASCPGCNRPRGDGPECPHCGLIYARWRQRPVAEELAERRVHLSLQQRQRLFLGLAEAIHAGLAPLAFVEAAAGALPAQLVASLRSEFTVGTPLSATLGRLGILAGADLAFLQAGEIQGTMPATLRLLAQRAAERRRDRGRVLLALAYPLLLAIGAVIIVPAPLIFREGVGAWAARVLPLLAGMGAAGFFALVLVPRMRPDAGPRRFLRSAGLVLPGSRQALRNGSIATFLEVLGSCVAAGIAVRQALPLALDAAPHPAFRATGPQERLEAGATLAEAVATIAVVPPATLAQIAQAEVTGTIDRVLPALVADHRQRARVGTLVAVVLLGLVAVGVVVGTLAWSVIEAWLAYFRQVERAGG